ncbi:MAG: hypothetical protein L3J92_01040 [Thermoplasmata archaeon]|jgi:hypothetical protein|nr:hypothetical protein [Thermoplasmata archaeon]
MILRTLLTMINLATIAVAIIVLYELPKYAGVAFYVLLAWMIGSLVLIYGPWANRPIGRRNTAGPASVSRPLPGPHRLPSDLGFCIYCAAPLAPGAPTCAACGHTTPHF